MTHPCTSFANLQDHVARLRDGAAVDPDTPDTLSAAWAASDDPDAMLACLFATRGLEAAHAALHAAQQRVPVTVLIDTRPWPHAYSTLGGAGRRAALAAALRNVVATAPTGRELADAARWRL